MGVADEIQSAREYGVVHCGLSSHASPSVPDLAAEFGLSRDPSVYRQIDAVAARRLVQLILNQHMAYNVEIIPLPRAVELADRFLDQFGTDGVRFYTNGTFHEARGPRLRWSGASWNPATEATLDTGVLVVGPKCSGCLWVEDED
jgi:hypothetical protein